MTKVIAITGQKGGMGYSTLTVELANLLAYKQNKKVAVLDCDMNNLISRMRALDNEANKGENLSPYTIEKCDNDKESIAAAIEKLSKEGFEYILCDNHKDLGQDFLETCCLMDFIFVPLAGDPMGYESNMIVTQKLSEQLIGNDFARANKLYHFWNKVDAGDIEFMQSATEEICRSYSNVELLQQLGGEVNYQSSTLKYDKYQPYGNVIEEIAKIID